jgi:hypothetical protein
MVSICCLAGGWLLAVQTSHAQLPRSGSFVMQDFPMDDEMSFSYSPDERELEGFRAGVSDEMGMRPEPDWSHSMMGADFGMGCPPRWYAVAEAFAMRRQGDSNYTLSNGGRFDSFDYELAGRATIGRTYDCLDGWEVSFLGPFQWDQQINTFSDGNLQTFLLPGVGLTENDFSAFNNADVHTQYRSSRLLSGEFNRRWWGWDVFSLKLGARYVRIEEGVDLFSLSGNEFGMFSSEMTNNLGLVQLGIDMMAPLGPWTFGAKLNGAIGINFNTGDAFLRNAGQTVIDNGSSSEEFAFLVEAGVFGIYRLTDRISLHAGYEAWYVWGLALPVDQRYSPVNFNTALSYYEKGDLFYHGGTLGVEFVW